MRWLRVRFSCTVNVTFLWAAPLIFLTLCENRTTGLHWTRFETVHNSDIDGTCNWTMYFTLNQWMVYLLPSTASAAVIVVSPVSLIALHVYRPESEPRKSTITKHKQLKQENHRRRTTHKSYQGSVTLTTWRAIVLVVIAKKGYFSIFFFTSLTLTNDYLVFVLTLSLGGQCERTPTGEIYERNGN